MGVKKKYVFEQSPYYANSFINDREAFSSLEGKKKSKSEGEKGNGGGRVTCPVIQPRFYPSELI